MITQAELAGLYNAVSLETERLVVRKTAECDRPTLHAHELDREMMKYIREPLPPEQLDERLDALCAPWKAHPGEWICLAVMTGSEETLIGIVAFRVEEYERESIEIGYRFDPAYHKKGFATEATRALVDHLFAHARPHKLVALCATENGASYRLMERLGMQREAHLRQFSRLGGRWLDEYVYGLLASDWSSRAT